MRYSIIKPDTRIYVGNSSIDGCDLSDVKNFHAIHYDTDNGGEIEYSDRNELVNNDSDFKEKVGISLSEVANRKTEREAVVEEENKLL